MILKGPPASGPSWARAPFMRRLKAQGDLATRLAARLIESQRPLPRADLIRSPRFFGHFSLRPWSFADACLLESRSEALRKGATISRFHLR